MADFGTLAESWPLMDQWDEEVARGTAPRGPGAAQITFHPELARARPQTVSRPRCRASVCFGSGDRCWTSRHQRDQVPRRPPPRVDHPHRRCRTGLGKKATSDELLGIDVGGTYVKLGLVDSLGAIQAKVRGNAIVEDPPEIFATLGVRPQVENSDARRPRASDSPFPACLDTRGLRATRSRQFAGLARRAAAGDSPRNLAAALGRGQRRQRRGLRGTLASQSWATGIARIGHAGNRHRLRLVSAAALTAATTGVPANLGTSRSGLGSTPCLAPAEAVAIWNPTPAPAA